MTRKLIATALAASTLAVSFGAATSPAEAQWRRGGYGRGYHNYYHRGIGPGAVVGGALLGLGIGALLAAPYAAPPPVVYAPPPRVYYYPPAYAYAPPAPYPYAPPAYYAPY